MEIDQSSIFVSLTNIISVKLIGTKSTKMTAAKTFLLVMKELTMKQNLRILASARIMLKNTNTTMLLPVRRFAANVLSIKAIKLLTIQVKVRIVAR
jgi:hypothetical protein